MTERQLKDILNKLEVPYAPETWDALSHKLDALQDPPVVDAVDKLVYRKIGRMETPYDPKTWDRMAHRLDVQRRRTLLVRFGKVLEAAAIILLLLRFAPEWAETGIRPPAADQPTEKSARTNDPVKRGPAAETARLQPAAPILADNGVPAQQPERGTRSGYKDSNRNMRHQDRTSLAVQSLPITPANVIQEKFTPAALPETETASRNDQLLQPLATPAPVVPVRDFRPDLSRFADVAKVPVSSTLYFAASFLTEWNQYRWSSGNDYKPSVGGSAAVGRRWSKWTVEGGIGYSRKYFTPKRETEILSGNQNTGYTGLAISGAEADVLQVPIRILRKVGQWGGLRLLALTGATGHLTLNKDYDFDAVYFEPIQTSGGNLPIPSGQPQRLVPGKGILEGGSLGENTWASLDLGIQLEYPLGKRSRLFLQPAVQIGLNAVELAPEPVYPNSFRVQAGLQTDL